MKKSVGRFVTIRHCAIFLTSLSDTPYPEAYVRYFGEDYEPPDYVRQAYEQARRHKWYMTSRLITVNDPYAFDPHTVVAIDDFEDVIGRHFRQPTEGLGFDNSPVAHMWRTMIWPRNSL